MPIPELVDGWLPPGEHQCTIDEIEATFGDPRRRDANGRRARIMLELRALLSSDTVRELIDHVYVDGSFVSSKRDPNDVDIVLGMREGVLDSLLIGDRVTNATAILAKLEGKLSERVQGTRLIQGFAAEVGDAKYERMRSGFQTDTREGGPTVKGILRMVIQ